MLSTNIEEILTKDGGWMSAGAILNRAEGPCTTEKLRKALDELIQMGTVQQIHGPAGLEYALMGAKLPAGYKPPAPVVQGKAEDVQLDPKDLNKPSGPRVMSAPSLASAPRPAPSAPAPATAKPTTPRDRVLLELQLAGKQGADVVQLMNRTACAIGNVYNALSDLRTEGLVRTEKNGSTSRHFVVAQLQQPTPPPAVTQPAVKPIAAKPAQQSDFVCKTKPKHPAGYTRDLIAALLAAEPNLTQKEIAERLGMVVPTVSYHLKNLAAAVAAPAPKLDAEASTPPVERAAVVDVAAPGLSGIVADIKTLLDAQPLMPPKAEIVELAPSQQPTRFALWSTGELAIERNSTEPLVLSTDETRSLVAYLDRIVSLEMDVTA